MGCCSDSAPQRVAPGQAPDAPPAAQKPVQQARQAQPISFLDSNTKLAALEAAKRVADAAAGQGTEKKVATG